MSASATSDRTVRISTTVALIGATTVDNDLLTIAFGDQVDSALRSLRDDLSGGVLGC